MDFDQYVPGNILYAARHHLKTTDGTVKSLVIGKTEYRQDYREGSENVAVFNVIAGFVQLNSSAVLVSDREHHCLRVVNRITRDTKHYMGTCTTSGYRDGENPLFHMPWGMVIDKKNPRIIYLTDSGNNAVRLVDMKHGNCSTIASRGMNGPRGLTFDWLGENLVISNGIGDYISTLNLKTGERHVTVGIPGAAGLRDENTTTSLLNAPTATIFISERLQFVADEENHVVRIVDLVNNGVYTICSGKQGEANGYICDCQVGRPLSLLYSDGYLHIGHLYGISKMRGIKLNKYVQHSVMPCPLSLNGVLTNNNYFRECKLAFENHIFMRTAYTDLIAILFSWL